MGFAPSTAAVRQALAWDCSAASLAWLLDALGRPTGEQEAIGLLGPNINPSLGLLDASGAPLASVLAQQGFSANYASVNYDAVLGMAQAGTPLLIGGAAWNHWAGVRGADGDDLLLANPSPGWMGVGDRMSRNQFAQLGPFNAVWVNGVQAGSAPAAVGGSGGPQLSSPAVLAAPLAWIQANPWLAAALAAALVLLNR